MPFLTNADAVTLVSLSEGETDLEKLATSARNVVQALTRHGIDAAEKTLELSLKPAAESILDEAYRLDADFLVMGGYGHSRMREFVFGGNDAGYSRRARDPGPLLTLKFANSDLPLCAARART
jgi:nucleotide-binding universal stress UspA family protein